MRQDRQKLIGELVEDLRPAALPTSTGRAVLMWLSVAVALDIFLVLAAGPLRPGALRDLAEYPAFAAETALAIVAIALAAVAALRWTIPGSHITVRRLSLMLLPLAAWVSVYIVGLEYPAHPVSGLGHRRCYLQIVLLSLLPLTLMMWMAARRFPLWPRTAGMLAGVAAGAIPAELMQFACVYAPGHILAFHLAPVLLIALLGAALGHWVLRSGKTHHPALSQ